MTPLGLLAMRKAAALAFAVPGMELDLIHHGQVVARVDRRCDGRNLALNTTLLSPCAFRAAVGQAHVHANSGGTAVFIGLGIDADPTLEYHMPFTGAARPLGLVVSRVGEIVVHVFATQRPVEVVRTALSSIAIHPALPDEAAVNASWDPVAAVTLVYSEVRIGSFPTARAYIESMMESLMVRFAIDEITLAVAAQSSRSIG